MSVKELIEVRDGECVILEQEEVSEGRVVRPMKIGGIASKGNVANENSRFYGTELWERESVKNKDAIAHGRFLGELDHPDDGKSRLSNTSVKYTKLFMDGDYLKFEAHVLDTTKGKDTKELLRAGVQVDVSTRGFGTTKQEKKDGKTIDVVQDDYELVAIDLVSGHSNLDAQVEYFREKKSLEEEDAKMDLETLKKDHPKLVAQIEQETGDRVRQEVTDQLTQDFEEKVLDEIAKTRSEVKDEVMREVREELVPKYEDFQTAMAEVADILKGLGLLGESETTPDEKDEKVESLRKNVGDLQKKLDDQTTQLSTANAEIAKAKVQRYLDEQLKGQEFQKILRESLKDCKTTDEVDERLKAEKERITQIIQESKTPPGTGEPENTDDKDKGNQQKQLEEDKKRQKKLAGV